MSTCAVHDCDEPAGGPIVIHGDALAPICLVHAQALDCSVHRIQDGGTREDGSPLRSMADPDRAWRTWFMLPPEYAGSAVILTTLDAPDPVLYLDGLPPAEAPA